MSNIDYFGLYVMVDTYEPIEKLYNLSYKRDAYIKAEVDFDKILYNLQNELQRIAEFHKQYNTRRGNNFHIQYDVIKWEEEWANPSILLATTPYIENSFYIQLQDNTVEYIKTKVVVRIYNNKSTDDIIQYGLCIHDMIGVK